VGKTRLAFEVAGAVGDAFADGVWFVDLAPIRDAAGVRPAIVATLGGGQAGVLSYNLPRFLDARRVLLVLDNFEQVLPAATDVADLLATCPGLAVLLTSRERPPLRWAHAFAVPPLALPPLDPLPPLVRLSRTAAVALFVERAHAAAPGFTLDADNARLVAEICHRLDGLPLAIEPAAARVPVLPPAELLARLEHRLAVLTTGPADLPPRHRTLRNCIAWSHDLLDAAAQRLFARLAVFTGGCGLDEVAAVCDAGLDYNATAAPGSATLGDDTDGFTRTLGVLPVLQSLVEKSLFRYVTVDGIDGKVP
jgi:predicted ATPase